MADENKTQTYVWPVELRENKITERTDDYTASVKTFSDTKSLEYIAKEIVRERTEYREDTILSIMKLVEEKIRHVLYSGYPVMTENVRFAPTITGSFDSHGELLDDKSMKCGVNVTVNQIVKDGLAGVKLYIDSVQELGGAKIDRVKDLTTGKTDGTVTPGGMVEVTGSKIKCLNADGSGIGHVTVLGVNDPSKIIFIFPTGLLAGNYRLEIETYFASGNSLLKNPRTLVCPVPLKVE